LSHLPHGAAVFFDEWYFNHPLAIIFYRSHSVQILAHPKTREWAQR